jgi:hypothetical protein
MEKDVAKYEDETARKKQIYDQAENRLKQEKDKIAATDSSISNLNKQKKKLQNQLAEKVRFCILCLSVCLSVCLSMCFRFSPFMIDFVPSLIFHRSSM